MSENIMEASSHYQAKQQIKLDLPLKIEGKDGYNRISVKGGGCSGMTYKMSFDNDKKEFDKVFESQGINIICDLQVGCT